MRNTDYTTDKRLWIKNSIQIFAVVIICLFLVMFGAVTVAKERLEQSNSEENSEVITETNEVDSEFDTSDTLGSSEQGNEVLSSEDSNSASISENRADSNQNTPSEAKTEESSSSISIEISSGQDGTNNADKEAGSTSLKVNGETIEIPESGRHRETIKDENSTTKLRTNIDSNGSSSIKINTESN